MSEGETIVQRVNDAVNRRDIEAMMACFGEELEIRFPCHPQRPIVNHERLAVAWKANFENVAGLRSTVATAAKGDEVWSEWHWAGKRGDADWNVRGVIIWTLAGGKIVAGRNHMEPVDD